MAPVQADGQVALNPQQLPQPAILQHEQPPTQNAAQPVTQQAVQPAAQPVAQQALLACAGPRPICFLECLRPLVPFLLLYLFSSYYML